MKKTIFALLLTVFAPVFFVNIAAQGPGEPVLTEPGRAAIVEAFVSQTGHSGGDADQLTITVERETLAVNPTAIPGEICLGGSTQLFANASGGIGTYTYSWTSEPEGFTSDEANPSASPQETTIYSVTVSDNSDQVSGEVTVTVHPLPAATASSNSPVCEGQTIELYGGPDGMASYSWTGPKGYESTDQNPTREDATYAMNGQYTLKVTDDNGCEAEAITAVVVNPLPEFDCPDYGPFCQGDDSLSFTETEGVFTFEGQEITGWNPDQAGSFEITYTVTDEETDCSNSCIFNIVVNPLPEFDCPWYGPFCLGDDEFTFTETEGVFAFEGQEITGWNPDQAGSFEITYTVTDEDTHCTAYCTFTILVNELPQFTIEGPNMVCPNLKNAEYEADITNFPLSDIELPPEWVVINGDIENKDSNKAWISWHNKPGEQGKITLTVKNKHTGCERTLFDHSITFSSHHQAPEPEDIVNKTLNDKTVILIYPEPNLEYQWFKNDTEVTGENGQYHYPGSIGFSPGDVYKVLVEPLNVNDFVCGNFSEPVTILEPKLYDFNPHDAFLMYPNPAGDHIVIVLNEEHENMSYNNCKAIIYNESGALLKSQPLSQWENHLSVSELPAGVYLVAIWVNGNREIKRMIKK